MKSSKSSTAHESPDSPQIDILEKCPNGHSRPIRTSQFPWYASFSKSLATIEDSLLNAPLPPDESDLVFGEPAYRLPHLKLLVCHAFVTPIAIHFGVSLDPVQEGDETILPIYLMKVQLAGVQEV